MKALNVIENFRTIIETAKSVKHLRLSEMSQLEQHAIQFCSWIKFARENPKKEGSLTYVKAEEVSAFSVGSALAPATLKIKELNKLIGGDKLPSTPVKLLSATSFVIMIDTTPIKFKEADPVKALEAYPEQLLIPSFAMLDTTNGLRPIVLDKQDEAPKEEPIDEFHRELTALLYKLSSRTAKLSKTQAYATHLILHYMSKDDSFLDTVRRFMPYFPRDLAKYYNATKLEIPQVRTIELEELENKVFKSIECTAVYWALKGVFIKV